VHVGLGGLVGIIMLVACVTACGSHGVKEDAASSEEAITVEAKEGFFVFLGVPEALYNDDKNQSRQRVMIGYHVTSGRRCNDITFMQAVQITHDGVHRQPSPGQAARMTKGASGAVNDPDGGWAIDQSKDGADVNPEPWYPLNPGGTYDPNLGTKGMSDGTWEARGSLTKA